jgi:hypothetical protein
LIGIKEGKKVTFLYDESETMSQKIIDNYTLHRQINKQNFQTIPLGIQWRNDQLLIVDDNRFYDFPSLFRSIVIL